jgi:hypothetical protein
MRRLYAKAANVVDVEELSRSEDLLKLWAEYKQFSSALTPDQCATYRRLVGNTNFYDPSNTVPDPHGESMNMECVLVAQIIRLFEFLEYNCIVEEHEVVICCSCRLYHEMWRCNAKFGREISYSSRVWWSMLKAYKELEKGNADSALFILRGFAKRGLEIVNDLASTRKALEIVLGVSDTVKHQIESELVNVSVPMPTAQRPYHLHYSESTGGGGDENHVLERLRADPNLKRSLDTSFYPWNLKPFVQLPLEYDLPDFKVFHDALEHIKSSHDVSRSIKSMGLGVCLTTARMEIIMSEKLECVKDMVNELTMWRALPLAMGLHPRLGKGSPLVGLSVDLVKLILLEC